MVSSSSQQTLREGARQDPLRSDRRAVRDRVRVGASGGAFADSHPESHGSGARRRPFARLRLPLPGHRRPRDRMVEGGKTEALLAFVARGAQYLGDEWIYVDGPNRMCGIPQPIRLWDWHLGQFPQFRERISGKDKTD